MTATVNQNQDGLGVASVASSARGDGGGTAVASPERLDGDEGSTAESKSYIFLEETY